MITVYWQMNKKGEHERKIKQQKSSILSSSGNGGNKNHCGKISKHLVTENRAWKLKMCLLSIQ
jgi:hypothetical protein